MSRVLRYLSRCSAYFIALLLAAVWIIGALDTFTARCSISVARTSAMSDFARGRACDSAARRVAARKLLAGLKFMVGAFLLAARDRRSVGQGACAGCDDATLDVALFTAALASVAAALPGLPARRRSAGRADRRTDAVPDRERLCDLRPRLSGRRTTRPKAAKPYHPLRLRLPLPLFLQEAEHRVRVGVAALDVRDVRASNSFSCAPGWLG
jgi:hypothetical protein